MSLGPFDSIGIISREILLGISSGIRSFSTLRGFPRDAYEIAGR
jgi:hypothetical protein